MKTEMNRNDVYEYVSSRMIERLEQGEIPWINTRAKPLYVRAVLPPASNTKV